MVDIKIPNWVVSKEINNEILVLIKLMSVCLDKNILNNIAILIKHKLFILLWNEL